MTALIGFLVVVWLLVWVAFFTEKIENVKDPGGSEQGFGWLFHWKRRNT